MTNLTKKVKHIKKQLEIIINEKDSYSYEKLLEELAPNIDLIRQYEIENAGMLPLSQFVYSYINHYDGEAQVKSWKRIPIQDTYENIWDSNNKSCILAPREHLKTTSLIQKLLKITYNRKFPLEINYYHLTDDLATEKFTKLKRYIQNSPLLANNFHITENKKWNNAEIELSDGTIFKPLSFQSGSIGKHPPLS